MEKISENTSGEVIEGTQFQVPPQAKNFEGDAEGLKDYLFNEFMKQHLIADYFEHLLDYLPEEDIDAMRFVLAEYSDAEVVSVLSLPRELRERMFEKFEKQIDDGADASEVMRTHAEAIVKHGFSVGFHTSPRDIRPEEDGSWMVKGTEADHRDDDRMMAYYSTQYRHLFKKRHPKNIYIVRTDPKSHKTDGNWSRADSLSIISEVPFDEVYKNVEATAKKYDLSGESQEAA